MKKIYLFILLSLYSFVSYAQPGFPTDPAVTGASVDPGPISGASPYAIVSFIFLNNESGMISNLNAGGNPDPIILTVKLHGGVYDNVHFANPLAAIGGSYAFMFTWTYDAATATYTGLQNQTIPGGDIGDITFGYKATVGTYTLATADNGIEITLKSNSNAPDGIGTNDTSNDVTSSYTYLNSALPVTLVSFTVAKENTTANLKWATTEETNADRFEIQRSKDAKKWAAIGEVKAAGESKTLLTYNFTDVTPISGMNYYRLKMIDRDQTGSPAAGSPAAFAYSRIQSVDFSEKRTQIAVYPNPVTNVISLKDSEGGSMHDVSEIAIVNSSGVTVFKKVAVSGTPAVTSGINVASLVNGIYVVKITRNGTLSTHKIVIAK